MVRPHFFHLKKETDGFLTTVVCIYFGLNYFNPSPTLHLESELKMAVLWRKLLYFRFALLPYEAVQKFGLPAPELKPFLGHVHLIGKQVSELLFSF